MVICYGYECRMDNRIGKLNMIKYKFHDDSGKPIDAEFEVREGILILNSRSGAIGTVRARNTEYSLALELLLKRIDQSELSLVGVWVDSLKVQHLSMENRRILFPEDAEVSPDKLATAIRKNMAAVGRDPQRQGGRGNSQKKLRFAFTGNPSGKRIARIVGRGLSRHERLSSTDLKQVSAEHIRNAVQRLLSHSVEHQFGESTTYDVATYDGVRLPPKAVFGLAASKALGFEVLPQNFAGGLSTHCFKAIIDAGYRIVQKNESVQYEEVPPNPDDCEWAEGQKRLVTHLLRERKPALGKKKKKFFRLEHGRLFCEHCGLDPVEEYRSEIGEACIEVHHKHQIADMLPGQSTKLEDLVCLCANCHRIEHRRLRNEIDNA